MKKAHYRGLVPRRKPYTSAVNKQKHLTFTNKYVNKSSQFWEKIMFFDESKFCRFDIKGSKLVRRKQDTAFEKQNLVPTLLEISVNISSKA